MFDAAPNTAGPPAPQMPPLPRCGIATAAKAIQPAIEVIGVPNAVVTPRQVDVSVIGPPEVIRALRAEQVVPRVDLTQIEGVDLKTHGSATVKVSVDVADATVEVQPPTVAVKW